MLNRHGVLGLVRVLDPIESEVLKNKIATLILHITFQGTLYPVSTSVFTLLCQKEKNSPPNKKALL